ncbi:MAG: hypothetical protein KF789_12555 [Bdellovibrionaceae bacterium]|nr:hypothetical protein [Pseudobdellovibrionaceae bacterium]
MIGWSHRLFAMMMILMGSFAASADISSGAGYVLYKALTRPSESSGGPLFVCPQLSGRGDLYVADVYLEGRVTVLAKVDKNGACVPETLEDLLRKSPCLAEPLARALEQVSAWNQDSGEATTQAVIVSTDPRVQVVKYGWGAQISKVAQNLKIVAPSCKFRIEIRTGRGAETQVLAQENL